jgi:hypothetical protein
MQNVSEEQVIKNVSCLQDRRGALKNSSLTQAAEHLAVSTLNAEPRPFPEVVEYTCLSGSFAYLIAGHSRRVAVLPTDANCRAWLLGESPDATEQKFMIVDELVGLERPGFVSAPEPGWGLVLLRDVLPRLTDDEALIRLLGIIRGSLRVGGTLVMTVVEAKETTSHEEIDGVIISETTVKFRPRVYKKTLIVRTSDEGYKHEERFVTWSVADLHSCAKRTGLKPVPDSGLDPTAFCCYRRES